MRAYYLRKYGIQILCFPFDSAKLFSKILQKQQNMTKSVKMHIHFKYSETQGYSQHSSPQGSVRHTLRLAMIFALRLCQKTHFMMLNLAPMTPPGVLDWNYFHCFYGKSQASISHSDTAKLLACLEYGPCKRTANTYSILNMLQLYR